MEVDPTSSTENIGFVLDPDTFKKIQPFEYYRRFFEENVRADGRPLLHFREMSINTGSIKSANGSVILKLGETVVICAIKAEIALPAATLPKQGYLVPNIDLPALCSSQFRPGPPGELTQSLSTFLHEIAINGHILDLDSLCIEPGRAVWTLFADIVCLNYAGNMLDAAIAALIAALRDVVLPPISIEDDGSFSVAAGKGSRLTLNRALVSSTFAVFDRRLLIADPTHEEESIVSCSISVVVDDHGMICGILKPGGAAVPKTMLDECIANAKERSKRVVGLLLGKQAKLK